MFNVRWTFGLLFPLIILVLCSQRNNFYKQPIDHNDDTYLQEILVDHDIIPDILDDALGTRSLEVIYGIDTCVNHGDELEPFEVRKRPLRVFWNSETLSYYALLLIDADSPSRENSTNRSFQHWMVGNIPGNNLSAGETIIEYVGAIPAKNTGLHRYVFLVFDQSKGKVNFTEAVRNDRDAERTKFSVRQFMTKYRLNQPIAINFFQAKYDDSVPASTIRLFDSSYDDQK